MDEGDSVRPMDADSRIELTVRLWSTGAAERFAEYLDRLASLLPRHRGEVARRIDSVEGGPADWEPGPSLSNSFGFGGHNGTLVLGPAD